MTQASQSPLTRFLHRLAAGESPLAPDAELLRRFARDADGSAFELLLWRHGPMVLRVCRAVLQDAHDAEDAFQAAFLVLARKAGSIGRREALGAWLYRVAYRLALKLHRQGKHRAERERQGLDLSTLPAPGSPADPVAESEQRRLLHAEVERLPAKYRAPVVLCYLEGRTNEEAAAQLGWTKGTVSGRLARARDLLRRRLERCGLPVAGGLTLTLLAGEATAALPDALVGPTLHAALTTNAGGPLTGLVSPQVLCLSKGAMTAMTALTGKLVLGVLFALLIAGAVAYSTTAAPIAADGDRQASQPGARVAKVKFIRIPAPQDGILLAVGTPMKKGGPADEPGRLLRVRAGKEVREYRRLRVGDKVEEGQMLGQLDDRLARTDFALKRAREDAAKADYLAAIAISKEAQARLDRIELISRKRTRVPPAEEYSGAVLTRDKHREEEIAMREMVKIAELEREQALTALEAHTIRSPVAGVLRRIHKHRGEAVRSLETLFEIQVAEED